MDIHQLATQLLPYIPARRLPGPQSVSPLAGLDLLRYQLPTTFEAMLYEPVICLIVQGAKETTFGDQTFAVSAGDVILISHDVPVVSRITEVPYLSLLLKVDLAALRSLRDEVAETALDSSHARAMEAQRADPPLIDALHRYLALAASRMDAKVLGPLILKEIHYRLLMAPFGGMFRNLVRYDSPASAIARAIADIRRDFRTAIAISGLAQRVGMSESAFHKHFKAITFATPLQYQKELRLLEARRLLTREGVSVSTAAYEVGYASPTQFSREYARKFGAPPSKNLARALGRLAADAPLRVEAVPAS
ncbi:MAG TPA: AraC family transcriptional regulator [Herpetosiphonaceae bacterium]